MEPLNEIRFYGSKKYPMFKEFSNFWPVKLNIDGKVWNSVEHYYQAMKTIDPDVQEDVRIGYPLGVTRALKIGDLKTTPEPDVGAWMAKKSGQLVDCREDWAEVKDDVMMKAIKAKYSDAHPELKTKLLASGDSILIEASPTDYYWGEGAAKIGKNMLGILLMDRRNELRKESLKEEENGHSAL